MKVYLWRLNGYQTLWDEGVEPNWVEQSLVDDIPISDGYPVYTRNPPENSIVNFHFNPITKEVTLNWSFHSTVITKDVELKPHDDIDDEEAEKEDRYIVLKRKHRTIPNALYYSLMDNLGFVYIAVVEEDI